MKFICKISKCTQECDVKLLLFAVGMVVLMFSQLYIAAPIEETGFESSLVEDLENETEEKSNYDNGLEDVFIADGSNSDLAFVFTAAELFFMHHVLGKCTYHPIEIPIPPPEQIV
jgi:hypothetical protein